ncbi:hypothetical protein PoB_003503100 [Plakobranchus ocellatus]|uniref:Uncharacterized protein n=1 Tax=Plakobranchus ocellatus TaxID=259542 RepID=A0AAV4AJR1_9GAST|nr:hypothetical protein PoB_003503100 [Plakobranchus ocellatus]
MRHQQPSTDVKIIRRVTADFRAVSMANAPSTILCRCEDQLFTREVASPPYYEAPVYNKVISDSQTLHQPSVPVAGLEPARDMSLQTPGRVFERKSPAGLRADLLCHQGPGTERILRWWMFARGF